MAGPPLRLRLDGKLEEPVLSGCLQKTASDERADVVSSVYDERIPQIIERLSTDKGGTPVEALLGKTWQLRQFDHSFLAQSIVGGGYQAVSVDLDNHTVEVSMHPSSIAQDDRATVNETLHAEYRPDSGQIVPGSVWEEMEATTYFLCDIHKPADHEVHPFSRQP